MPEMKKVSSSHVWEIGYDAEAREFHVKYQPSVKEPAGRLVIYHEVDEETAQQIMAAPSVGLALHSLVRRKFEHR